MSTQCLRGLQVPVADLLVLVRGLQKPGFIEIVADQLHTDWQTVDEPSRQRHAGQPGEVQRYRVDILQVHAHRIVGLGADGESDFGRGRTQDQVDAVECRLKVIFDHAPQLLRLEVIGVVITGR